MEAGTRRDHSFSLARKPLTTEMTARVDRFEFRGFAFTRGSSSSVFFFFSSPASTFSFVEFLSVGGSTERKLASLLGNFVGVVKFRWNRVVQGPCRSIDRRCLCKVMFL